MLYLKVAIVSSSLLIWGVWSERGKDNDKPKNMQNEYAVS